MSSMKGGFSTLNRWFGRKKDKSGVGNAASNGKLSKSTTQLHHLSTDTNMHINEASQLDYNRITPLPVATSNAPFEQTFRITVLLPKDQLYVARLGARVPLSKLLSLVCDNKQLDADKYEFRNPVDASQVYSCESTIGAVGLSEIRLCHKSESYDSYNADSMLKFQRTVAGRDSLSSSSDFSSSRHSQSKLTLAKTPSPYSSSNSLNSMDSTGMNYTRTPVVPPKALAPPPRKKRVAPRPPSQLVIPEQSVPQFNTEKDRDSRGSEPAYAVIVKRPQMCMSTPNLASTPELETETEAERERELATELDCNGNSAKTLDVGHYATLEIKTNGNGGLPEPTPRKRLIQLKKKAAPAPPPDASMAMSADTISLASTTASISEMAPQPAPRITTPNPAPVTPPSPIPTPETPNSNVEQLPPPLPASAAPQLSSNLNPNQNQNQNVSKVLLNRTPTPEPRSLSSANEEEELEELEEEDNNDAASKQADSGIGEPVATPLNSTSPSPEPEQDREKEHRKTQLESSSEDEEAVKVYNFKTSRETSLKTEAEREELPLPKATTLAELTVLTNAVTEETATEEEDEVVSEQPTPNSASELTSLSSWNYAVPISPPPDFSDARSRERENATSGSPLDEIVDELSTIINQQRLDTLIRQAPEQPQIEAAKPNRLANFSIAAISNGGTTRSGSSSNSSSTATTPTTPKTITRADSFQAVGQSGLGLRLRSSSQLSLNKLEIGMGNGSGSGGPHPRRSSSELSIAESPSLQSLELIKTILSNSRKNSLADSPDSPQPVQVRVQLETIVKPKKSPSASPSPATSPVIVSPLSITPAAVPAPIPSPVPVATTRANPVEELTAQQPAQLVSPVSAGTPSTPSPASPAFCLEPETKVVSSPASVVAPSLSPTPSPSPAAAPVSSPAPSSSPLPAPASAPAPVPAAKPLPPTYRYSGPPNINFATWSERPKSQVAIKNEGDYIFGGATTSTTATSVGATAGPPAPPTKPVAAPAKLTIEVASPILRMGIPRKEYHVPITVKPLRDASEELEKEQHKRETQAKPAQKEELSSTELRRETFKEPVREPLTEPIRDSQRDLLREPLREPQRDLVKPSTLPRPAKSNRFTLPAQAHSTLTSPTAATTTTMLNATSSNSLPRPLSTLERKPKEAEPVAVPFGQNTLRRTGFKERMLAKELEEKEQALRVRVSVNGIATPTPTHTPTVTTTVATTAVESKSMIIRSSKLELKLQQQQEVAAPVATPKVAAPEVTTPSGVTPRVATPDVAAARVATPEVATPEVATPEVATPEVATPDVATQMLQVKLRPTSQVAAKVATASTPPPPPLAPPAPAKAKPMRNVGVAAPDPRTQLLDAIRNFKREELNRA